MVTSQNCDVVPPLRFPCTEPWVDENLTTVPSGTFAPKRSVKRILNVEDAPITFAFIEDFSCPISDIPFDMPSLEPGNPVPVAIVAELPDIEEFECSLALTDITLGTEPE